MEALNTNIRQEVATTPTSAAPQQAVAPQEEKGAIGIAFLVWLFGGGLGLAILIFVLLKVF